MANQTSNWAHVDMKHILVVEDEEHLAIGIKYNLEAEGYHVSVAGDGPTALETIQADEPVVDLVILDLMLPGMSGYSICETLRQEGNPVPVLMLSARTLSEDRTRGFDVGADQYLTKPFELDELLSRVRNLLSRHARASEVRRQVDPADLFEFNNARINFNTYEVRVDGHPQRLSHLEMKLLRYFVENEGRVITRDELLENVWGHATSPTTRTVDNFVLKLRKCFEKDPGRPEHFLTVHGTGYRFVAAADGEAEREQAADDADAE